MRWKTSWIISWAALLAVPGHAGGPPLVVGAAVSQTGLYADAADGYRKGLLLWEEELNAGGGLLGRRVALRLLDDASEAAAVGPLYERLIQAERVELLIGPFGSAATLVAAAVAERSRRVLVNGSGPARTVHRRAPRYVFQVTAPYAAYGTGVLALVREAGYRKLLLLARNDPISREMAEGAREAALKLGLEAGEVEVYGAAATDFAPQVARARSFGAEAWIAFGGARDAAETLRSFKLLGYAPKLFFHQGAADPQLLRLVGQDAEAGLGLSAYDPEISTPGNAAFAKAYARKWSAAPGLAAAQGYAAGQVLAAAVRRAGALDQEMLRQALSTIEPDTVLGAYRVDAANGEQLAMRPAVVQILKGRREVKWPPVLATAPGLLPYPPWSERKILKGAR